jgi:urease accessory protein
MGRKPSPQKVICAASLGSDSTMRSITDAMRLLQFGDSVLPVGSFSFSNGVEAAVQQRIVHDKATLKPFVETALQQAASCDGIALLDAHRAAARGDLARVVRADRAVLERKLNEEMRTMTLRMGRKLAEMTLHVAPVSLIAEWRARIERSESPGTFPIALALVFVARGLPETDAFAAHQYGVATMMLQAALRLMKLNYLDAQAILYDVNATAETLYRDVASMTLDDMAAFAPVTDILAAIHVRAHVRMFMN